MLQSGQNWDLFGYDVRQLLSYWRSAWREFLWGEDSPAKAHLDEVLRVHSESGLAYFQAGQAVRQPQAGGDLECEAVLLPDSMVLVKILVMPLAVESDLDSVMALEVTANSPFPDSDTGSGWRVLARDRDADTLSVQLAIVSLSSVMSYLGQHYDSHDLRAREVWVAVDEAVIVLSGFGEQKRLQRYNKRLLKVAGGLAYCGLLLVIIFGISAGVKYLQLEQLRSLSAQVQAEASDAIKMRTAIVTANETITAVNALAAARPNPHFELARLTHLLGDDASLLQVSIQGTGMDIRGIADDASVVVQQLTDQSAYKQVTAPQAITKYFNTGQEQFFLHVILSGDQMLDNGRPAEGQLGELPE